MPPKQAPASAVNMAKPQKRKNPPTTSSSTQRNTGRGRATKRFKMQDARSIVTQTSDAALHNGELDLQAFLKAREFEIKALEEGMQKSKEVLSKRAFQSVPRDMRRRTASHNVKRVPRRLQNKAAREMRDDNTPTVTPNKRKPGSSRGRLRAETAKKLGILAARKKASKISSGDGGAETIGVITRTARPKIRRDKLNDPPKPKAKFRKRQIDKTWLPTHLWHAKRARMTEPKIPLWRFAMPITSTEKSYRPTHRAGGARGAVAWDTSYMSTIRLEGPIESLEKVFRGVGVSQQELWDTKGEKWRAGKRSWSGWLSRRIKDEIVQIGPATIIWSAFEQNGSDEHPEKTKETKKQMRQTFVRIHPAAFLETWTELLRLSKQQRPSVNLEDLRFEIGSIEMTGPGSTETLLGILHPIMDKEGHQEVHGQTFTSLAGVTNPASLPLNALLSFSIMDPRLRYPPRPVALPKATDEEANFSLLQTLSSWPADHSPVSSGLFDRGTRLTAARLPSQKALNRRKALASPGSYASILPTDPPIPIMLLASRTTSTSAQGTWTLVAPWKCILPIWYGIVHYPLSTGGNPRFGGQDELRQIHFEHGIPWFPADYPATNAGFEWELEEKERRKREWDSRPKGKRIGWHSLDLGAGRKGEVGLGWSCDFEKLLGYAVPEVQPLSISTTHDTSQASKQDTVLSPRVKPPLNHLPAKDFNSLLSKSSFDSLAPNTLSTVRITLVSRGVATPCARIYRLPLSSDPSQSSESSSTSVQPPTLRQQWLSLLPAPTQNKKISSKASKAAKLKTNRIPLNTPLPQRIRLLAQSLLQTPPMPYPATSKGPEDDHPLVPGEEDLIGFVTTGHFNLAEGNGTAIGSVLVAKVLEGLRAQDGKGKEKEGRLCIVRNAGEKIGRLARWEVV